MTKFICTKCGKIWYTANNHPNQKCDECGSELKEENAEEKNKE